MVGQRTRTLVTRFGEVTFRRRLYRDPQGKARSLLDEVLDLPAYQPATADVTEAVVALAAETAFVRAAQVLERLTGGVLSPSTIWRLVQQVGQAIQEAEAEEVERVFGQGQPPRQRGPHTAPRLYIEADGVMVRQRTGAGHTVWREVRCGLAYDDASREQAYVQGPGKGNFWVRWWRQKGEEGENLETLGHIESQVRALIAHRMKGKGRHWSARGLRHLAKVRQELRNGGLPAWCGRHRGPWKVRAGPTQNARIRSPMRLREDPGAWMQAHLPLLEGPVPTSPALLRLRQRVRSG